MFVFMGGTFDPIHNGHLRSALEVQQWLGVEQIHLVPARTTVHRDQPGRTAEQRLAMVEAAVQESSSLTVDAREVVADQPSYTLYTLQQLRAQLGDDQPICMVIGMDSLLGFTRWHGWEQFMSLCHILVLQRPGYPCKAEGELAELLLQHRCDHRAELFEHPCGRILFHEQTPLDISATHIRSLIEAGHSPQYLLPDAVWQYIKQHQLYGYAVPDE